MSENEPAGSFSSLRALIDYLELSKPQDIFIIAPEIQLTITFSDLACLSRALSARFARMGLSRGDKIALMMNNGSEAATLFLGAIYSGCVVVPLNVRGGVSQLAYTLVHSDAKVVFYEEAYRPLLDQALAETKRAIDTVRIEAGDRLDDDSPRDSGALAALAPDDPAMLIYTSGSTGRPKGALHTHRSILAHGRNSVQAHRLTEADRSLMVLPLYHINAECVTLIPTLMSGGSLVAPQGFLVSEYWNWFDDYRCTWSAIVPTIISQLIDWNDPKADSRGPAFSRIRFIRSSSAPLSPALHREFVEKYKLPLIQAMGSSEGGNVFSNPVPPGENKIGSPGQVWGFEVRLMGPDGLDAPAGEPGEIWLRGDAMMKEYYKDPEGTAAALDAEGWLHTGDLARRDEDGYFFIVGRSKELIIKSGMNVAPKQIDEVLEQYPGVFEAAAVGVPDRYVGEDIVAFAVLRKGVVCDERELLAFCESKLGQFKTPTRVYFVDDLPKGPSGKAQRLKLVETALTLRAQGPTEFQAARGGQAPASNSEPSTAPIEQMVKEIWAKLLADSEIGLDDNFFALGGHSLMAIQCLSLLRERLRTALSLADFFENATIRQLAALVRRRLNTDEANNTPDGVRENNTASGAAPVQSQHEIPRRDPARPISLSPGQRRIWFMEQLVQGEPVYNESDAVRLTGEIRVDLLEHALNEVVARHEALRTIFALIGDEPAPTVLGSWRLSLTTIDLSLEPPARRESRLAELLISEPRKPFKLTSEPPVRATLVRLGDRDHALIIMMHHIICDYSSLGILWTDLAQAYSAGLRGEAIVLPALPIQYSDYAAWREAALTQPEVDADLRYWRQSLEGAPDLLDLPTDHPRPASFTFRGAHRRFVIAGERSVSLRNLARRQQVSQFNVFAAALYILLHRYSGQDDIVLGLPLSERDRPELAQVFGFFLYTHALRAELSPDMPFAELLRVVQKATLDLYAHRSPTFDAVVQAVQPRRNAAYSPLFQVMLNWRDRDQLLSTIGLQGVEVECLVSEAATAKFDLTFMLTDAGDVFWVDVEYCSDLFDADRIERMFGHLVTILAGVTSDPQISIGEAPMLTAAELQQLLPDWSPELAAAGAAE